MHFIYVMDEVSKDKLIELGYKLINSISSPAVWVFDNPELCDVDDILDEPYIMSDVLTF